MVFAFERRLEAQARSDEPGSRRERLAKDEKQHRHAGQPDQRAGQQSRLQALPPGLRREQRRRAPQQHFCAAQADGVSTLVEVVVNQELGAPFRRDAMRDQACLLERYKDLSIQR